MGSRGSGWVKPAYRYRIRGPEPQLLSTNLRLRWISAALGLPIFILLCVLFGSSRSLYALGAVMLAYLAANAGLTLALRRSRFVQLLGCLCVISDLAALSATLAIFGQLQGPLVGMYAIVILGGASMWSGLATAIAGLVGVGCYATALALTLRGVIPKDMALQGLRTLEGAGYVEPFTLVSVITFFTVFTIVLSIQLLRKRAAAAEGRYQAVFDAAPTPILIFEPKTGKYLDGNEAAVRLSGLSHSEIVGGAVGDLLEPESGARLRALLMSSMPGSSPTLQRLVTREGRELFMEIALAPAELGGREAVVLAARDRTAEIRLEQERREYAARLEQEVALRTEDLERTNGKLRELQTRLVEAERLGIAGEVAGGIAHAIYNPLAALIGHVELKLEASRKADPRDEHVLHLARRIEAVVEGMLTLSRRGKMRPEPLDLGKLVGEVHEELAESCRSHGVEVELRVAPDLPRVMADRALLTTALASVVENAVDAMADGGKLFLDVDAVPAARVVRVRIRDTGAGVPPKIRGRIFEPFYSTKPRAVGLGLAIARGIILGHEGSIQLESELSVGTEVTLEIPLRGIRERQPVEQTPATHL